MFLEIIPWDLVAFFVLGGISIIFAIAVLYAKEIVRGVIYLLTVFISIAGIFILLSAEYVAIIQIMIYGGAVTVLILFAVMLTKREIRREEE